MDDFPSPIPLNTSTPIAGSSAGMWVVCKAHADYFAAVTSDLAPALAPSHQHPPCWLECLMSHITERAYGSVNIKQNYDRDVAKSVFFFIIYVVFSKKLRSVT